MNQRETHANADAHEHGDNHAEVPFGQHHRQQHSEQRHHRADGKLDASSDDHQAQANAENAKDPDLTRQVLQVDGNEKVRVDYRHDHAKHDEQNKDASFLFHN